MANEVSSTFTHRHGKKTPMLAPQACSSNLETNISWLPTHRSNRKPCLALLTSFPFIINKINKIMSENNVKHTYTQKPIL
jgi:hypothetical protein